jgi:amidase
MMASMIASQRSSASTASQTSSDSDICFLSAVEMARLIHTGKLSAREVLEAHLRQIERVNPKVNAIVTLVPELAREAAAQADEMQARGEALGPLHGLPVAHKDLFETSGIRTTFGSALFRDHVPTEDDIVVARMRAAGAITIGKTNTPEFGAGSQTFNGLFGATRNPWYLTKTCGGSTGGGAVALACGMTPLATGTDVGGSLRNPAAFCNVAGFRPSIGVVPNPKVPIEWSTLNTSGCLGRSIADLALGLSSIAEPGELFARPLDRSFDGVRIAWFKDLGGAPFDARVRAVIDRQRATFELLGCIVEEAEPDFGPAEIAFRIVRAWNSARNYGGLLRQHPDAFKDTLKGEIEDGLRLTGVDLAQAEAAHNQLGRNVHAFFERFEYFVLPTVQLPPFDIGMEYPQEIAGVTFGSYIDWMKSCWYISATGSPAASVPGGFTAEGLSAGLQIVGRRQADFSVLQLAYAFEQATGFGKLRPEIVNLR